MTIGRWGSLAAAMALVAGCAAEAERFNWDDIGQSYCRHAVVEDLRGLGPILTPSLRDLIARAAAQGTVPPRLLLQSYDAEAPGCVPSTRNVAIVDIRREAGSAAWTDSLIMVPEPDGSTRIDDVLFSTRPSDTLRERLRLILATGR